MQKVQENHVFIGVQRDLSVSKHPIQYLYDARNIRLTAREGNTLMSITSEKSTAETTIAIQGSYLGHCLLNEYLVIFSHGENKDYIARINLGDLTSSPVLLYGGEENHSSLGFSNPIEAIGSYETADVQKIYWVDGENQPRVINIAPSNDSSISSYHSTSFDFVPTLQLQEEVVVRKEVGTSGEFAPGVIQYCFTYYNKHGQETNIFYTTPLIYVSPIDRGGNPEEKIHNSFHIQVSKLDPHFDYLRIYSLHRSSYNAVPFAKRVQDISLKDNYAPYLLSNDPTGQPSEWAKPKIWDSTNEQWVDFDTMPYSSEISTDFTLVLRNGLSILSQWRMYVKNSWVGISSFFPDLSIQYAAGKVPITWPSGSGDSSCIWISKNPVVVNGISGYCIVCTDAPISGSEVLYFGVLQDYISFIDTGTEGDAIDPTELLYKGGEMISAETLEQKDNTLFLGNLNLLRSPIPPTVRSAIRRNCSLSESTRVFKSLQNFNVNSSYPYSNQLTSYEGQNGGGISVPCGGFKHGDYYRCGVQFQHESGKWSDPIFIGDKQVAENKPAFVPNTNNGAIQIPTFNGTLASSVVNTLLGLGYKRARAVVVFPDPKDRVVVSQGILCPTMYTDKQRGDNTTPGDLYAQSSWFFRFRITHKEGNTQYTNGNIADSGAVIPTSAGMLEYTDSSKETDRRSIFVETTTWPTYNPARIRLVEIGGDFRGEEDSSVDPHTFDTKQKFQIDRSFCSFHSPDLDYETGLYHTDFSGLQERMVGKATIINTLSDVTIQTSSGTISNGGSGFCHQAINKQGAFGLGAGLFYNDFVVRDGSEKIYANNDEKSSVLWMVYPWQGEGPLNNDFNRPADMGTPTAQLSKKVLSNLRYGSTGWRDYTGDTIPTITDTPQLYDSEESTVIKVGEKIYQGTIDKVLTPTRPDGKYFAFEHTDLNSEDIYTPFYSSSWWKTFSLSDVNAKKEGLWKWYSNYAKWGRRVGGIGNVYLSAVMPKALVRMKYKSTPHLVYTSELFEHALIDDEAPSLPIIELLRPGDNDTYYRSTMFGGVSEDALRANIWLPCGEPVSLQENTNAVYHYSYGDTYFQRWDCLKTYPYTREDQNQIVEIGSFMLETRNNIDGRYDRNRGQINNLNISPINFNLFNPVYNQRDNFFSYRIQDDEFYETTDYPNQITWSLEKSAGSETDLWSHISLASAYDVDGSKGALEEIVIYKDQIFCFQDRGVGNLLFNSRVQIATSDNVPIEIGNSQKVDGYRELTDGVGCDDKHLILKTPLGIYFIDSVSSHLCHIEEGLSDLSQKNNMTTLFQQIQQSAYPWQRLTYDPLNHDVYAVREINALCYSEKLSQFTGFYDYGDMLLTESYDHHVFALKDTRLYKLFEGNDCCHLFEGNYPWHLTFICNGINDGAVNLSKTFTNIEFRAGVEGEGTLENTGQFTPTLPLDHLETWNEYQHGYAALKDLSGHASMQHHTNDMNSSLKRKFRIWRCDIPRNNCQLGEPASGETWPYSTDAELGISRKIRKPVDRMSNPWLYLKLWKAAAGEGNTLPMTELHDINLTYFV